MEVMNVSSWTEFKTLVSEKQLLPQYREDARAYELFAAEGQVFMWTILLLKGSSEANDFESGLKAQSNKPIEIKGGAGKPQRTAASAQPLGTVESWKGFHKESAAGEATFTFDIWIGAPVYLKGGVLYSDDCTCEDFVSADIVLKANPSVVIVPKILDTVYLLPNAMIPFMSEESMLLPAEAMIRATYTKKEGDTAARCLSALMDFFK
jgi:hypothetical protein